MNGKSILSFLCSITISANQFPFPALFVKEEFKTIITLEDNFSDTINVLGKIYDKDTTAEIDLTSVILKDKRDGDDIYLTADASFDTCDAGTDKTVTVTNFALEGTDAQSYELNLPEGKETIELKGDIFPIEILLIPDNMNFSEITEFPQKIDYTYSKENILEGDTLDNLPELFVSEENVFYLDYGNQQTNPNYQLVIDKNSIPNGSKIQLQLEPDFEEKLTYSKVYDGTGNIEEIDISSVKLIGTEQNADVYLTANAEFTGEDFNAGQNKEIKLTNLTLQGDDAYKYQLELPSEEFYITGEIIPKTIYLTPDGKIVEGESNKKVNFTYDDKEIIDGDEVDIKAEIWIEKDSETNKYIYVLHDEPTTGNPNYKAVLQEGAEPETTDNPDAPTVSAEAEVSPQKATVLKYSNNGIIANESVSLKVSATAKQIMEDGVTFTLSNGQTARVENYSEVKNYSESSNNEYIYYAAFEISLPEDVTEKSFQLSCKADNGAESQEQKLTFKIEGNSPNPNFETKSYDTLIIDKQPPSLVSAAVNYDNYKKKFSLSGKALDAESGIAKIEYKLSSSGNYHELKSNTDFSFLEENINYEDANNENAEMNGGRYHIYFKITDNAGNECFVDGYYCGENDGQDIYAPVIRHIKLSPAESKIWEEILNILTFGNYSNSSLTLSLKAEDKSESNSVGGIKSVELIDKNSEQEIVLQTLEGNPDRDYLYEFDPIAPDQIIEKWYVRITDIYGNRLEMTVREALQMEIQPETETTEVTETTETTAADVTETETETTTAEILPDPYLQSITQDKWIFDATPPEVKFSVLLDENMLIINDTRYYNLDPEKNQIFTITVYDENDIADLKILQQYTNLTGEVSVKEISLDSPQDGEWYKYRTDENSPGTRIYEFDTSKYDTGWYSYTVTAIDYAGNISTNENSETVKETNKLRGTIRELDECRFYVDHELPLSEIKHISPEHKELNEPEKENVFTSWITEKDKEGNPQPMTFRLYPVETSSPLYKFNIFVNNQETPSFSFDRSSLMTDEDGKSYIDFTVDPNEISYTDQKTYEIYAQVIPESGNASNSFFTLHIDTQNPTVNRFTVEKENSMADTILNVLSFGAFANDSLIFKAHVSDSDHDSGVDYVTIQYNGLTEPVRMEKQENGIYYSKLDLKTQIFQSDIYVTVYDKMGNASTECPNIENTNAQDGVSQNRFVMQETISPEINISLPDGDGVERYDNEIWYRTDKEISLTVHDENSGIRQTELSVNGQRIDYDISGNYLLTAEDTRSAENRNNNYLNYKFSTEVFADNISPNEDGSYILEAIAVDNAGNVASMQTVYYRDAVNPVINQFVFNPVTSDSISETSNFIEQLEYGFYFKQEFEAIVQVSDEAASSGLDKAEFRFVVYENGEQIDSYTDYAPIIDGQAVYNIPAGFKGQIYAKAYDNVGNISDERTPQGFVIDNEPPKINISVVSGGHSGNKDGDGNGIYTSSVGIEVIITDTVSGLRSVSYSQYSEKNVYSESADTNIENIFSLDSGLENGWEIVGSDANLVTQVKKTFYFDTDDNAISMTFYASDRSGNESSASSDDEDQLNEKFTIDTTAPVISAARLNQPDEYSIYANKAAFEITVTERNFDETLMTARIKNTYKAGNVPEGNIKPAEGQDNYTIHFEPAEGENVYKAVVTFDKEGDYEFSFSGEDMGGNFTYMADTGYMSFSDSFRVDTESPVIITNFGEFGEQGDTEIYFNGKEDSEQKIPTAQITVSEHNFYSENFNIYLQRRDSGTSHSYEDETWDEFPYISSWKSDGDTHTLNIDFETDGIYRIIIDSPQDHSGHSAVIRDQNKEDNDEQKNFIYSTAIFEYDNTPPNLEERNVLGSVQYSSSEKNFEKTYTAVYGSADESKDAPKIRFFDENFDRIELKATVYTTSYSNKFNEAEIIKEKVEESEIKIPQFIEGDILDLKDYFKDDGVYILEYTAYDKAGNQYSIKNEDNKWEETTIKDTYFRMIHRNVFAYMPSEGYYFFTDKENGRTLSKKLDDFKTETEEYQQFEINVIRQTKETNSGILFVQESNDSNKQHVPAEGNQVFSESTPLSDTAELCSIRLDSSYFSTIVANGQDKRLSLCISTSKAGDRYLPLELAEIHIDNEKPSAEVPDEFKNWKVFLFTKEKTFTLKNVSEDLNENLTSVMDYTDGRSENPTEIKSVYDRDMRTLTFTLGRGQHDIDIKLVDEAGNEYYPNNVEHLWVGNFWLYIGITAIVVIVGALILIRVIIKKRRRHH